VKALDLVLQSEALNGSDIWCASGLNKGPRKADAIALKCTFFDVGEPLNSHGNANVLYECETSYHLPERSFCRFGGCRGIAQPSDFVSPREKARTIFRSISRGGYGRPRSSAEVVAELQNLDASGGALRNTTAFVSEKLADQVDARGLRSTASPAGVGDVECPTDGKANAERLIEESFRFLLERESNTSILRSFRITDISRYFPEYEREIRRRLAR
jgi:hypothetical protein